jgi:hypothetical protein
MKKKVYMMESYVTYVNKGALELDLEYFPELQGLSDEQIAKELEDGKYYVADWSNEIMPKQLPETISEKIKQDWTSEDGELEYDSENLCPLWEWHRESEVVFDKIKNEESYFIVS